MSFFTSLYAFLLKLSLLHITSNPLFTIIQSKAWKNVADIAIINVAIMNAQLTAKDIFVIRLFLLDLASFLLLDFRLLLMLNIVINIIE